MAGTPTSVVFCRLRGLAVGLLLAGWAAVPAAAIEVERVLSPGGIEAWLVRDHTNPIIAARIAFRGGAALDPVGKEGLAEMTAGLLDEGAGELDSQAFQRRLEDLAITLHFDAGRDSFGAQVRTLSENRAIAFDLLRMALTAPRFDPEPVARVRSQMRVRLNQEAEDPDTVASRTLSRTLFPDHPYGREVRGTPEGVAAITTADLRRFAGERLGRDNLVIGVVGDITAGDLAPLLDSTFGRLPAKATPWQVAETTPAASGKTVVVRKTFPQSAIAFGQAGPKRDDPDYYVAFVMNHVLGGGGFTSRLYDEVREKRGLAYSISSSLFPLNHAGLIWGAAGTVNARVGDTLRILREEWRRMATAGITDKELADAKTYLTGSFPLRFTASGSIAAILVAMQLDRLGIDFLDRRNAFIEAVTRDDVNRVARQLLDPDRLTVVVVGEPEGLSGVN